VTSKTSVRAGTRTAGSGPVRRECHHGGVLAHDERTFLATARRAVLGTIAPDGRPRLVPICFVLDGDEPVLYSPLDDKPKRSEDPLALARIRDIGADPRVTVLVDRWDEDWSRLAWLRCSATASVQPSSAVGHGDIIAALRAKYPQYETHRLEGRPLIRIEIERVTSWGLRDRS
jgi:PPOX class probable F420-dependent enzyme